MSDTVTFIVGGQSYAVGPLVLYQIERAEPVIAAFGASGTPTLTKASRYAVDILAIALMVRDGRRVPDTPSGDDLAMRLLPDERAGLMTSITDLMRISGYEPAGEAVAATAQPSPPAGAASSPN